MCTTDSKEPCAAAAACDWDAIQMDPEKGMIIDDAKCVGCQACVDACKLDALKTKKDIIPVVQELHDYDGPVYALIAPAFSGQL